MANPRIQYLRVSHMHQVTGLNEEGKYFMKTCPANPEDYFEFFAEVRLNIRTVGSRYRSLTMSPDRYTLRTQYLPGR